MVFRIAEARKYLQIFDLPKLFVEEMGWDRASLATIQIATNGDKFSLTMIAQKRGFAAYLCSPMPDGKMPDAALRYKIETQVRKYSHEHLIIFTNQDKTIQKWQWVRREQGKPISRREFDKIEIILQRLQTATFDLSEEDDLTIIEVGQRMKKAFDVEKVTKKFYERFQKEHEAFLKFIKGIPDKEMQRHYVSVTLNRLMFIYFIQKKQFLNNDPDYLRHHLEENKQKGKDKFYTDFLCPLFFEGFAKKKRSAEIRKLLGNVPYLNGGIFEQHQIEELHSEKIQIPDKAFEQLFDFFDEWRWHLDERPNKEGNEINPDVLGYIFERYINNQAKMGAYYTKEDITEYISRNTIIPHLVDVAQKECKVAFEGEGAVWRHLQTDPNRYIYTAVRYGVENALPKEVAAGESDPKRREEWNKLAPEGFALPTEIWREVVARRRRYQEVKEKLSKGEVASINDLITLNLDIRQFAQDVIQDSDADLLLAFWKALTQIKVLDPTVGSGAFLFAALNVLEPLYEACVERMSALVEELDRSGEKHSPKKYEPFRKVLEQVRQRPDEDYFIYKSIIINNLYGVDIMEEAVEICKLRLFLKLASQVESDQAKENLGIEPLPDIDFNIRAGNTLVGFATREDVKRSVNMGIGSAGGKEKVQAEKLFAMPEEDIQLNLIEEKAKDVDRLYKLFRQQQTEFGGEVRPEDKRELQKRLVELEKELNILLAKQYAIHNPKGEAYQKWLESHTPFHWFVEFFSTIQEGGFDVIIGNPPYVATKTLDYELPSEEEDFPDIYANVLLRSLAITKSNSRIGMIVPLSITFSGDLKKLREKVKQAGSSWFSSYDNIPAAVFAGVSQRCTIWIGAKDSKVNNQHASPMYRWRSEYRPVLTQRIQYTQIPNSTNVVADGLPKLGSVQQSNTYLALNTKINHPNNSIGFGTKYSKFQIGFSQAARNFVSVFLEPPPCIDENTLKSVEPSKIGFVDMTNERTAKAAFAVLAGEFYLWYWLVRGDGFDVTTWIIKDFIKVVSALDEDTINLLAKLGELLDARKNEALAFKKNAGKYVGNYNYKKLYFITRRADLLLMKAIGLSWQDCLEIFDYVQRVLSINVFAGEKSIPDKVKSKYPVQKTNLKVEEALYGDIDKLLVRHYGLSDEELDFIINYDVKYRTGASAGEEDSEM
ncbi:MAG: Eco57I restriction-modification methylase domain-containing protein [Anaerolineae bacterium]|nr:Eco57I restriction-modification methylase domain-containing protein [Anaerolineae bacterium]